MTDYRKLHKYPFADKIDGCVAVIEEEGHEKEVSIAGFLRFALGAPEIIDYVKNDAAKNAAAAMTMVAA